MKKRNHSDRVFQVKIGDCTEVEFSPHAILRLHQRGLAATDVISALKHPKKKRSPADFPHKGILWKKSTKKTLCVIYQINEDRLIVITAYWK